MKVKTENYFCTICGRKNVKLWRPYKDVTPLICAECAEKRQVKIEYDEQIYEKKNGNYIGKPTGKKITLKKWKVDKKGNVPSYDGPGPIESDISVTNQLIIDISDVSDNYSSKNTTMIPAYPDENCKFYGYSSCPENIQAWWEELPTR